MENNNKLHTETEKLVPYDKIKDYLLGGNDNLIGTVLAIRKGLRKTNYDKYIKAIKEDPNTKHYLPVCASEYWQSREGWLCNNVILRT